MEAAKKGWQALAKIMKRCYFKLSNKGAGTRFLISKFLITKFLITKFLITKFLSNKVPKLQNS
jgi:hypothetical protein